MVSDRKSIEDVIERVDEYAQMTRTAIEDSMPGTPIGSAPADDEAFAQFYEKMSRADKDWARALPYVDGGMAYVTRYEKIRGLR